MNTVHECEIGNVDFGVLLITDRLWIYDSEGDFVMDYGIEYCPKCGVKLLEF